MCDLVKDNALSARMSWRSLIELLSTTRNKLEALIFSRGVHLEAKVISAELGTKSGPIAFSALHGLQRGQPIHS